jgi:hypothetical protein
MQTLQNKPGLQIPMLFNQTAFSYKSNCCLKSQAQSTRLDLDGKVKGGYLYKLRKAVTQWRSVVESDRRSVQQSSVDEPGPHHPAQVGRPGNHVTFSDVLEWKGFNRVQGHVEIPLPRF